MQINPLYNANQFQIELKYGALELSELSLVSSASAAIVTLNQKVLSEVQMIPKVFCFHATRLVYTFSCKLFSSIAFIVAFYSYLVLFLFFRLTKLFLFSGKWRGDFKISIHSYNCRWTISCCKFPWVKQRSIVKNFLCSKNTVNFKNDFNCPKIYLS